MQTQHTESPPTVTVGMSVISAIFFALEASDLLLLSSPELDDVVLVAGASASSRSNRKSTGKAMFLQRQRDKERSRERGEGKLSGVLRTSAMICVDWMGIWPFK